jgi:hypothetical protein
MRKCALAAMVALAALMTWPLTASAEETALTATSNDTARGSGSTPAFPFGGDPAGPAPAEVSFSSVANFNGTEPRGWMKATIGANDYAGDVTCQMVSGNEAVVGGHIDQASSGEFNGAPAVSWQIAVSDLGNSDVQMTFSIGPTPPDLFFCAPEAFEGVMTEAEVEVHDG